MSLYSLVAAIFGMNIPYSWKAPGHEHVFKWVCMCTSLATIEKGFQIPGATIVTGFPDFFFPIEFL